MPMLEAPAPRSLVIPPVPPGQARIRVSSGAQSPIQPCRQAFERLRITATPFHKDLLIGEFTDALRRVRHRLAS